jgi:hypothetical protein
MHARDAVLCGWLYQMAMNCHFRRVFMAPFRGVLALSTPSNHTPHIPGPTQCATLVNRAQSLERVLVFLPLPVPNTNTAGEESSEHSMLPADWIQHSCSARRGARS